MDTLNHMQITAHCDEAVGENSVLHLSGGVGAMATMARPVVERVPNTELHVDWCVSPVQFVNVRMGGWMGVELRKEVVLDDGEDKEDHDMGTVCSRTITDCSISNPRGNKQRNNDWLCISFRHAV